MATIFINDISRVSRERRPRRLHEQTYSRRTFVPCKTEVNPFKIEACHQATRARSGGTAIGVHTSIRDKGSSRAHFCITSLHCDNGGESRQRHFVVGRCSFARAFRLRIPANRGSHGSRTKRHRHNAVPRRYPSLPHHNTMTAISVRSVQQMGQPQWGPRLSPGGDYYCMYDQRLESGWQISRFQQTRVPCAWYADGSLH